MKLFNIYIISLSAIMLLASPVAIQAATQAFTPQSTYDARGYDKSSNSLYSSYQQRRLPTQTQTSSPSNHISQTANTPSTPLSNSKLGNQRPALRKITFQKSEAPKTATAPQPAKSTTAKTPSKSSSSMGGGY